jgi:hypothetical protein
VATPCFFNVLFQLTEMSLLLLVRAVLHKLRSAESRDDIRAPRLLSRQQDVHLDGSQLLCVSGTKCLQRKNGPLPNV